jgi:5-methylthioadenosine/S-adenosylhomocysteine deaminase
MKFAGFIHKDKMRDVLFLTTAQLLEMATADSAKAMHRTDVGRLAPGMKADIAVVDLNRAHTLPVYDTAAALVYSARADDVIYTIADGRVLLDKGVMAGIDEEEVRREFRKHALALRDRSLG